MISRAPKARPLILAPARPLAVATLAALLVVSASCRCDRTQASDDWNELMPGVRYMMRTTMRPLRAHAVLVDLCARGVSARPTAPGEGPATVTDFAERIEADIAINGDFFGEGYRPLGLAVGEGQRWPGTRDRSTHGIIAFGDRRAWMPAPADSVSEVPEDIENVVGGRPALIRDGEIVAPTGGTLCASRHPRTAVGLSADGRTLLLVVVDGRSALSAGMTCRELAGFMRELGAHDALNLDGGGSSALWIRGRGVVNRPSDGMERAVANHIAIRARGEGAARHCPRLTDASTAHQTEEAAVDRREQTPMAAPPVAAEIEP